MYQIGDPSRPYPAVVIRKRNPVDAQALTFFETGVARLGYTPLRFMNVVDRERVPGGKVLHELAIVRPRFIVTDHDIDLDVL
jgi:hypothetical protein